MQREVDVTQRQNASIIQGLQTTHGQTLWPWLYLRPRHGRWHVPRPNHHFGHLCRGQRAYGASAHELTTPEDRHGVRKRFHLTQLVGNHQHGHTALARHRVQQPQHFIGFPWREHGGRFIENEQLPVEIELLEQFDFLLLPCSQGIDPGTEVNFEGHRRHECLERLEFLGPTNDRWVRWTC